MHAIATKSDQTAETIIDDSRVCDDMPFTADQKRLFDEAYEKALLCDAHV